MEDCRVSGRSCIYKSEFRGQIWAGNKNFGVSLQVAYKATGLNDVISSEPAGDENLEVALKCSSVQRPVGLP